MAPLQPQFRVVVLCLAFATLSFSRAATLPDFSLLGSWPATPRGQVSDVQISGTRLYVASGTSFCVGDISTANEPRLVSRIDVGVAIQSIRISSGAAYAYLSCGANGLKTVDLSDP